MTFEFWLIYVVTVFVASIIPGPSMLLALTHGIKYGARGTVAAALGNVAASLLQAMVTIAGLGAVLTASQTLFMIIKWCGAGYLVWTGIALLRSTAFVTVATGQYAAAEAPSWLRRFLQSFWVAAGNPKAILFFTALFPQFIDIRGEHLPQYAAILITLAVIAFVCFMIYAQGGAHISACCGGMRWPNGRAGSSGAHSWDWVWAWQFPRDRCICPVVMAGSL